MLVEPPIKPVKKGLLGVTVLRHKQSCPVMSARVIQMFSLACSSIHDYVHPRTVRKMDHPYILVPSCSANSAQQSVGASFAWASPRRQRWSRRTPARCSLENPGVYTFAEERISAHVASGCQNPPRLQHGETMTHALAGQARCTSHSHPVYWFMGFVMRLQCTENLDLLCWPR